MIYCVRQNCGFLGEQRYVGYCHRCWHDLTPDKRAAMLACPFCGNDRVERFCAECGRERATGERRPPKRPSIFARIAAWWREYDAQVMEAECPPLPHYRLSRDDDGKPTVAVKIDDTFVPFSNYSEARKAWLEGVYYPYVDPQREVEAQRILALGNALTPINANAEIRSASPPSYPMTISSSRGW